MPLLLVAKWLLAAGVGAVVGVLVAAQLGFFRGPVPAQLGVRDGRLAPPSNTPNSVHSQADLWPEHRQLGYARIAPLPLVGGDGPATIAKLRTLAEAMPGAQVVEQRDDYLYVRFSTKLMRYVDDAEFWFDPAAGVVQVRSASRVGRRDFGVNRARIESLRRRLAAG